MRGSLDKLHAARTFARRVIDPRLTILYGYVIVISQT